MSIQIARHAAKAALLKAGHSPASARSFLSASATEATEHKLNHLATRYIFRDLRTMVCVNVHATGRITTTCETVVVAKVARLSTRPASLPRMANPSRITSAGMTHEEFIASLDAYAQSV